MDPLKNSTTSELDNSVDNITETSIEKEWPKIFKFYSNGVIGFAISIFGIAVNIIAIRMLARQRVQVTFHSLMSFLAIWDLSYLFVSISCFALPEISASYFETVFLPMVPFALPIGQIFLTGSIYSTLALTVERYIAICAPFFRLRNQIKALYYIVPIILFAPLYNIPRFFELENILVTRYTCFDKMLQIEVERKVFYDRDILNENISHCWNRTTNYALIATSLRNHQLYIQIYMNYLNLIATQIGPLAILIILNCMIYKELRKSMAQNFDPGVDQIRRNISQSSDVLRKRDIRLTRISIVIVFVFIICHVPRMIPNITEMANHEFLTKHNKMFSVIISINQLLLTINSTVNYLIYYILCGRGRQTNSEGSPQQFIMLNRTNTQLSRIQVGGKGSTRRSTSNSTNIYQNNIRNSHFMTGNDHEVPEISILNQDGSINEGMIIQNGGQLPYQ